MIISIIIPKWDIINVSLQRNIDDGLFGLIYELQEKL
jgi:hypothetical protein